MRVNWQAGGAEGPRERPGRGEQWKMRIRDIFMEIHMENWQKEKDLLKNQSIAYG